MNKLLDRLEEIDILHKNGKIDGHKKLVLQIIAINEESNLDYETLKNIFLENTPPNSGGDKIDTK